MKKYVNKNTPRPTWLLEKKEAEIFEVVGRKQIVQVWVTPEEAKNNPSRFCE